MYAYIHKENAPITDYIRDINENGINVVILDANYYATYAELFTQTPVYALQLEPYNAEDPFRFDAYKSLDRIVQNQAWLELTLEGRRNPTCIYGTADFVVRFRHITRYYGGRDDVLNANIPSNYYAIEDGVYAQLDNADQVYHKLLRKVLIDGRIRPNRTDYDTKSCFGVEAQYYLSTGFPLLTTKRVPFRLIVAELLWFLSGSTNIAPLTDQNVHIWDLWADENGDLGPIYGAQWHRQLPAIVKQLRDDPYSRRHLVVSYQVDDLADMALPPCHYAFQFFVEHGELDILFTMRSNDLFLGHPFNVASYALLLMMVAQVSGLRARKVVFHGADVHLYVNHLDQARTQLERDPLKYKPPTVELNPYVTDLFAFTMDDIKLYDYESWPVIKADIAK